MDGEREKKKERKRERVCERERERKSVCVREREREQKNVTSLPLKKRKKERKKKFKQNTSVSGKWQFQCFSYFSRCCNQILRTTIAKRSEKIVRMKKIMTKKTKTVTSSVGLKMYKLLMLSNRSYSIMI
jgi:hypothetical protein